MRLAIGDIHGRAFWKNYIHEDFTEFYFAGDYFDSYNLSFARQCRNFIEICKTAGADRRIKLCLGNHDYHYLNNVIDIYSGYQEKYFFEINQILEKNIGLLKVVYVTEDNYIISHAGVSEWFMERMKNAGYGNVEDINTAFTENRDILRFNGNDPFGDDITQSPIWIRPASLEKQALPAYNQIVGHTPVPGIRTVRLPDEPPRRLRRDIRPHCERRTHEQAPGYQISLFEIFAYQRENTSPAPPVTAPGCGVLNQKSLRPNKKQKTVSITYIDTENKESIYRF
ncbi:MAG: metallophosphoesterase [Spirochaetaceae bacterium]|jgi:hypothetical protein|nr:metallophosphoesterase [Spirochaetaceae bacterium]